jgi:hypothetical protein
MTGVCLVVLGVVFAAGWARTFGRIGI